MAALSKTQGTTLLALQSVASNGVVISSVIDVTTKFAGTVGIHFGRRETTALTAGMIFRLEGSTKSSGDGHWHPLATYQTAIAVAETEAVSGTVAAGSTVITVASTANLVAGDIVYIDNTTIGLSEWGRIRSISSNTSVTIEDALINAQTGSTLYDQGELITLSVDLTSVGRIRLVADGSGTGRAVAVEAIIVTGDAIA